MMSADLEIVQGEESLYDVVAYGIWCLDGVAFKGCESAYAFLDELYSEQPDVGGDPGWTIERIELGEGFEKSRPYLNGQPLEDLKELQRRGEKEAFWIENIDAEPSLCTYSSEAFWRAVRKSLLAYGRDNPKRQPEVEEAFRRYSQLGSLPHPPFEP